MAKRARTVVQQVDLFAEPPESQLQVEHFDADGDELEADEPDEPRGAPPRSRDRCRGCDCERRLHARNGACGASVPGPDTQDGAPGAPQPCACTAFVEGEDRPEWWAIELHRWGRTVRGPRRPDHPRHRWRASERERRAGVWARSDDGAEPAESDGFGYDPGHPWFWKLGGAPPPLDRLGPCTRVDVAAWRWPKRERQAALAERLRAAQVELAHHWREYRRLRVAGPAGCPPRRFEEDGGHADPLWRYAERMVQHVCGIVYGRAVLRDLLELRESWEDEAAGERRG